MDVTYERDEDGRAVNVIVVEDEQYESFRPRLVLTPGVPGCTCGQPWMSVTAPPPCPMHGNRWWLPGATVTMSTPGQRGKAVYLSNEYRNHVHWASAI